MAWDTSAPANTDLASLGDDAIRTLKTDLQTALRGNTTDGLEAKFPGSDTANPIYRYRGLKGTAAARPTAGQYGMYFNTTRNALQRDNGSSWDDVGTVFPAGTVTVFFQAAAPTGWTKSTSHNDKVLRVVSGAGGGDGGTLDFSTGHSHTVDAHTHTISSDGSHSHTITYPGGSDIYTGGSKAASSSTEGAHDHTGVTGNADVSTMNTVIFKYIDVILCSKD